MKDKILAVKEFHKAFKLDYLDKPKADLGIEFVKEKTSKTPFEPEDKIGLKIARAAQRRGLIVRPLGNIAILSPTLIMDEEMIDEVVDIMSNSIREVQSAL